MNNARILAAGFVFVVIKISVAATTLNTIGAVYTQDFDTLAASGTSSVTPAGWAFTETLGNGNGLYTASAGSATGDTYSFGTGAGTDRAFGTLQSGALLSMFGAGFLNNTGATITSLEIAYYGEQWRMGATGRVDRLDFEFSLDATTLATGAWNGFDPLDFTALITTGGARNLDGNHVDNRTLVTSTITGLSIPAGSTFWIRWTDFNASGSDDGLGIDDFSLTPRAAVSTPERLPALAPLALVCALLLPLRRFLAN